MVRPKALPGEAEFRNIADNLPALCWLADHEGNVIYRNKRWYEYCGVSTNIVLSPDWSVYYDPDIYNHLLSSWQISIATGKDFKETFPLKGKDGLYRSFLTHAVPIRVNGFIIRWLGVSADVTERIRAEKELRESEELLKSLNQTLETRVEERADMLRRTEEQLRQSQKMEAVGQLTGGLAHDFNNILTGIMGNLELMQMRIQQRKFDDLDRFVESARTAGNRAASLTQRLLAFSRRQTLDPKPVHVSKLIENMSELLKHTIGPDISLRLEQRALDDVVLIDGPQLENAFLNLCINSRDALPHGGEISIAIRDVIVDLDRSALFDVSPGEYIQISVADNGCGMNETTKTKAFDPFFTTKPIGQGTGLGLSMIYGFSRQSKGHVVIDSVEGQGTEVSIYLPRHTSTNPDKEKENAYSKIIENCKGTILLVDDEETIRYLLLEVLHMAGYQVIPAADGIEALKVLQSDVDIDLLITDVGLPNGMNGRQVADAAVNLRSNIKVLFITGYAEKVVMGDNELGDGIDLLTKPFSLEEVVVRSTKLLH